MMFNTPSEYAVLALLLFAGWLFGLASHPGGKKWRVRYEKERDAHNAYRTEADARVGEANARAAKLEGELRDARATQPVAVDRRLANPDEKPVYISENQARSSARPAVAPAGPAVTDRTAPRGWFDWTA